MVRRRRLRRYGVVAALVAAAFAYRNKKFTENVSKQAVE
jgi:hypothetical protein